MGEKANTDWYHPFRTRMYLFLTFLTIFPYFFSSFLIVHISGMKKMATLFRLVKQGSELRLTSHRT